MLDNLGNILLIMCVVIVVVCAVISLVGRIVVRRRVAQALAEFEPPTDAELLTGLRELAQAVRTQQERDMARDVHRRTWR